MGKTGTFKDLKSNLEELSGRLDALADEDEVFQQDVGQVLAHFSDVGVPFQPTLRRVMASLAVDLGVSQQEGFLDALRLLAFSTANNIYPQLSAPVQEHLSESSFGQGGPQLLAAVMVSAAVVWTPASV